MFDISNPNEDFREIKILMNGFYGENHKRTEEVKKLKEALQLAELKTEEKLRVDDIEGYTTSKNEEEFYRRKIKAIEEMKPVKVDLFKLRELVKEEREKIVTEFEEGKEPLEKAFLKALKDLCDFMEDKRKRHESLRRLVDSFNMKDKIGVSSMILKYLDGVDVSYYNNDAIELQKGFYGGPVSLRFYLGKNQ
ncbi:hypothetical protein PM10SUCC1_00330 [Propionigenium maris DSM 9537]|uniref:Uncharacterized protein n=1 Tax=Propionigenium maris DSM 9537 TaxID=1123000 RepID=A0A9W6GFW4_9FUSO|nr:hypothetical protein [Propionigenium maris]GLI54518.1 hypothetical protein PM10SUCC1_00330 [Propionigenium maris DSM 9537]